MCPTLTYVGFRGSRRATSSGFIIYMRTSCATLVLRHMYHAKYLVGQDRDGFPISEIYDDFVRPVCSADTERSVMDTALALKCPG